MEFGKKEKRMGDYREAEGMKTDPTEAVEKKYKHNSLKERQKILKACSCEVL